MRDYKQVRPSYFSSLTIDPTPTNSDQPEQILQTEVHLDPVANNI